MAKFYSTAQLSERISETPEGFLVCEGVAITRAGDLLYAPGETPIEPANGGYYVTITRSIDDIHDPATIASFEGKPVTINHPDDFVTPENWRELAVGVIQNVRPGEGEDADKLLADLLITDREAISAVKSKMLREVSCGYEAEYVEVGPGKGRHRNIIGNHLALVAAGRCGSECAIFDHAPKQEKPMKVSDLLKKLLASPAAVKAMDEAPPEEGAEDQGTGAGTQPDVAQVLAAVMARLDQIEAKMNGSAEGDSAAGAAAGGEGSAEGDAAGAGAAAGGEGEGSGDPVEKRLSVIEAALAKLLGLEQEEHAAGGAAATGDAEVCKDQETIARAEILAPGIAKTADVKIKALDAAYGTEEGKAVITVLLAGKAYDQADKDLLFIAASEMLKGSRRQQLNQQVALDKLPGMQSGAMTPEKINAMNAERYGKK